MSYKILRILVLAFLIVACSQDDGNRIEVLVDPPLIDTAQLDAIIDLITNGDEKVWQIDRALLTNSTVSNLDITALFNVQDDEFRFSNDGLNQISLRHIRGYALNSQGTTFEIIATDINASSLNIDFEPFDEQEFIFATSDFSYSISANIETENIQLTLIPESGVSFNFTLEEKTLDDYATAPTSIENLVELFSFDDQGRFGFKYSPATNNLFITVHVDQLGLGEQQALRYNLETSQLSTYGFNREDFFSKAIEFIDNGIVSTGGRSTEVYDENFDAFIDSYEPSPQDFAPLVFGSAALDNAIYFIGGFNYGPIGTILGVMPQPIRDDINILEIDDGFVERTSTDGEIIDNIIYFFGGQEVPIDNQADGISNDVLTYNIETQQITRGTLNVQLPNVVTGYFENLIFVGSSFAEGDQDQDGNYIGVFNTLDGLLQEINISIPDNKYIAHIQANENALFIITENENNDVSPSHRVYRANF